MAGDGSAGRSVVGANLAIVTEVFGNARAAAEQEHGERKGEAQLGRRLGHCKGRRLRQRLGCRGGTEPIDSYRIFRRRLIASSITLLIEGVLSAIRTS